VETILEVEWQLGENKNFNEKQFNSRKRNKKEETASTID